MSKFHFVKGMMKNFFNPRVSKLSFVSSNNILDSTTCIYRWAKVKGSSIGAYTYIANNTDVENAEIGKFCSIADHCRIGLGGHVLNYVSTSPIFVEKVNGCKESWTTKDVNPIKERRVVIGNDVWIGSHVIINGGVQIGNGAVIGAGAVVVKDVPPYAIVGGVPAKVIRFRFEPEVAKALNETLWWDHTPEDLIKSIELFQTDKVDVDLCTLLTNKDY